MSPTECAEFLTRYNEWRRCDADDEDSGKAVMPHPTELGVAIDEAIRLIKQRDELLAALEPLVELCDQLCRWDRRFDDALDVVDAAIASVKGAA